MGQAVERRPQASSERRVALRFCLMFAAFTVAVFIALYGVQDTVVFRLNRHVAWLSGAILSALGAPVASRGAVVSVGGFAVEIKNNCNAIYEARPVRRRRVGVSGSGPREGGRDPDRRLAFSIW